MNQHIQKSTALPYTESLCQATLYPTRTFILSRNHFNIILHSTQRIEIGLFSRHLLTKIL
jgi:hypothetical protein